MPKKYYPGGFRLTKKTAAALAVRELGTARGLEREPGMPEGYFHILFGNLEARIFPDASDSSHLQRHFGGTANRGCRQLCFLQYEAGESGICGNVTEPRTRRRYTKHNCKQK